MAFGGKDWSAERTIGSVSDTVARTYMGNQLFNSDFHTLFDTSNLKHILIEYLGRSHLWT